MRQFLCFVLTLILILCVSYAEEVDLLSMTSEEIADYVDSIPLRDSLILADKYDLPVEEYFSNIYNDQIDDMRSLSDPSIYLTYCLTYTIMQERDLMKYLPILGIDPASSTVTDMSNMTFDELSSLRSQILMEMMARSDWQEVDVPVGTYQVGVDIPVGRWKLTCAPQNYCYVTVGATLEDNKKEIVYGSKGYYHIAMAGTESGISDRGYPSSVDLDLTDGLYVCIERAYVTFTPYTGTTGFVFK